MMITIVKSWSVWLNSALLVFGDAVELSQLTAYEKNKKREVFVCREVCFGSSL